MSKMKARSHVLSAAAALMGLGIVLYPAILNSPAGWSHKFSAVCFLAAVVFFAWRNGDEGFWSPVRAQAASLGCLLWGLYLFVFGFGFTYWLLDLLFFVIAALLWLGRTKAVFILGSIGILCVIGIRHAICEPVIIISNLVMLAAVFWKGAPGIERWLSGRAEREAGPKPDAPAGPNAGKKRILQRVLYAGAAIAVFAILAIHAARPTYLMVRPDKRVAILAAKAPSFPIKDPGKLSPLAGRLRAHVAFLADEIGVRSAYEPAAQEKAKDYLVARLKEMGYTPALLEYRPQWISGFEHRVPFYNIEATLQAEADPRDGIWILGAHYDSAPGTPGADDNASATAILLEAARLLKAKGAPRTIRFVAFGTEEPPAFGKRDMGSFRYVKRLRRDRVKVHGVLVLEMLGYFNPNPASQLFPPFLHLFYPDRGNYAALVSNLSSWGFMRSVRRYWKDGSDFPLETTVLPSGFSILAISDQLNFWFEGYPAVMLTDTSFFRNPYYHRMQDSVEKLDYEAMAEITRAVVHVLGSGPGD